MKKFMLTLFTLLFLSSFTPKESSPYVYVCTDSNAKVYHSTYTCKELNNCKGDFKGISLEKALELGKKKCKICY